MKTEEIIAEVQKKLGVHVDGRAGPETWGAIYARIVRPRIRGIAPARAVGSADPRSETCIATLLPEVRPIVRSLVHKAAQSSIQIRIISGLRTPAEQDKLYARGRTMPGAKVTNARGGYSDHNFGIAFDVGVFEGSKYLRASAKYQAVGALGTDLGLEWGGNWKSLVDQSHFQLRPAWARSLSEKQMLAELRDRVASGKSIYA
jgi:peptidoglycan L-alanyl-D-glutamate endopeptidase CwlK